MTFVQKLCAIAIAGALVQPVTATAGQAPRPSTATQHRCFGWLLRVDGSTVTLQLRDGHRLVAEATSAFASGRVSAPLYVGKPAIVEGWMLPNGILHATVVKRAGAQPADWPPDR